MGRDSDQDDAGLMEGEEPGKAGGDEEFLADPERDDEPPSPEAELLNDVTQHYLNEIGAKPLFTPDEEYFWASRAQARRPTYTPFHGARSGPLPCLPRPVLLAALRHPGFLIWQPEPRKAASPCRKRCSRRGWQEWRKHTQALPVWQK